MKNLYLRPTDFYLTLFSVGFYSSILRKTHFAVESTLLSKIVQIINKTKGSSDHALAMSKFEFQQKLAKLWRNAAGDVARGV